MRAGTPNGPAAGPDRNATIPILSVPSCAIAGPPAVTSAAARAPLAKALPSRVRLPSVMSASTSSVRRSCYDGLCRAFWQILRSDGRGEERSRTRGRRPPSHHDAVRGAAEVADRRGVRAARGRSRARPDDLDRGTLCHDAAGRLRRRGGEGRAAGRWRRRAPLGAAVPGRRITLVPLGQPQQAEPRPRLQPAKTAMRCSWSWWRNRTSWCSTSCRGMQAKLRHRLPDAEGRAAGSDPRVADRFRARQVRPPIGPATT